MAMEPPISLWVNSVEPKKIQIRYVCNLEIAQPALWEQLILVFVPLQKLEGPMGTIWFKNFSDRLYIYKRQFKEPLKLEVPFNGGRLTPWLN